MPTPDLARPRRLRRPILLAALLSTTTALVVSTAPPGLAQTATPTGGTTQQPSPPTDTADPRAVAARLAQLDTATTALEAEIATAQQTLELRRSELAAADAAAGAAETAAAGARDAADLLRGQVDGLVVAAYGGARTSRLSAVLVSDGPQDLLDRMTALDLLGTDSAARTTAATAAVQDADRVAADAVTAREAAAVTEQRALTVQADVTERRAELKTSSARARTLLAELKQTKTPDVQVRTQVATSQRVDTARASRAASVRKSLFAQATVGRITSPFGPRGGTVHTGVDIANTIGTPIWSVSDGTVLDAGSASGFGQWVRIGHPDGTISVYGHIDTYIVAKGDQVSAGQQIATIGNRGQSTGPHLHLEIITPGGGKTDPVRWLAERGITA